VEESLFNIAAKKTWKTLNWPNRISLLRLMLVPPFVVLMMNHRQWGDWSRLAALAIFVVTGLSDFADGMLARRFDSRTRLGAILDPLADKVLIIASAMLLTAQTTSVEGARLSNWVVVAIIGKDLWLVLGFLIIYLVTDRFLVRPGIIGKVTTVAQVVMVALTLLSPELNRWIFPGFGSDLALGVSWIVTGLCTASVISYTRMGMAFVAGREKPLEDAGALKEMLPSDETADE